METLDPKKSGWERTSGRALTAVLALACCCVLVQTAATYAAPARERVLTPQVPPYHARAPRGPLPQVPPWTEFAGNACAENAYRLAAQIRPVLYQQPCYCPCSAELGHRCLLDCFTRPDKHAAICATCMQEAIFSYEETMQGVSAQAIRAKIIKGDWKKIDLAKFNRPPMQ